MFSTYIVRLLPPPPTANPSSSHVLPQLEIFSQHPPSESTDTSPQLYGYVPVLPVTTPFVSGRAGDTLQHLAAESPHARSYTQALAESRRPRLRIIGEGAGAGSNIHIGEREL